MPELHLPGYNYAGPGTELVERLESDSPPINALDACALIHDIDFSLPETDPKDADAKFVQRLEHILLKCGTELSYSTVASIHTVIRLVNIKQYILPDDYFVGVEENKDLQHYLRSIRQSFVKLMDTDPCTYTTEKGYNIIHYFNRSFFSSDNNNNNMQPMFEPSSGRMSSSRMDNGTPLRNMSMSSKKRKASGTPPGRGKAKGEGKESKTGELLTWNNMKYLVPTTNSITSARNLKVYQSSTQSYTTANSLIVFTVQTGSQYVDWSNSWLRLDVKMTAANDSTGYTFGNSGSALNWFNSIVLQSRSGVEVSRIDNFNLWSYHTNPFYFDEEWESTVGSTIGFNTGTQPTFLDATFYRFAIPMYLFGGLFDSKQLCPASLASGLRVELRIEDPRTVAVWSGGTDDSLANPTFEIKDPTLVCDTFLIADTPMRELNMTSAKNGLEVPFIGVHTQKEGLSGTDCNVVISKAVSRACNAVAIKIKSADRLATDVDSFRTLAASDGLTQYQWRIGSNYYPHQPVYGAITNDSYYNENYLNALYSSKALPYVTGNAPLITKGDFATTNECAAATFERSTLLKYSGVPINNSRTLSFDGKYTAADATDEVYIFLHYVTIAKSFLNNVVISL